MKIEKKWKGIFFRFVFFLKRLDQMADIDPDDLFFAVKTWSKFHRDRVPVVQQTWARHTREKVVFFSDLAGMYMSSELTPVPSSWLGSLNGIFCFFLVFFPLSFGCYCQCRRENPDGFFERAQYRERTLLQDNGHNRLFGSSRLDGLDQNDDGLQTRLVRHCRRRHHPRVRGSSPI